PDDVVAVVAAAVDAPDDVQVVAGVGAGAPHDVQAIVVTAVDAPDDVARVVRVDTPDDVLAIARRALHAPDDVLFRGVLGNAPIGAEADRVSEGIEEAARQQVIAPEDVPAPDPLHWDRLTGTRGRVDPREPHGAHRVEEAGALSERVVA